MINVTDQHIGLLWKPQWLAALRDKFREHLKQVTKLCYVYTFGQQKFQYRCSDTVTSNEISS